jgi:hypothetical protein
MAGPEVREPPTSVRTRTPEVPVANVCARAPASGEWAGSCAPGLYPGPGWAKRAGPQAAHVLAPESQRSGITDLFPSVVTLGVILILPVYFPI